MAGSVWSAIREHMLIMERLCVGGAGRDVAKSELVRETSGAAPEPGQPKVEEKPATRRRCSASWARLISKVFLIACLHDQVSISRILDHLGLGPRETAKPPPAVHEVVRVPVDEEGREIEAP